MLRDVLTQKGLSNREAEVAELVVKGLSNKEVANQLFVTEKTVKFHLTNIYKKMNVKSRAQLIVWCMPYQSFVENKAQMAPNHINNMGMGHHMPMGHVQPQHIQQNSNMIPSGNQNNFNQPTTLSPGAGNFTFGSGTGTNGTGTGTGTGNDIGSNGF